MNGTSSNKILGDTWYVTPLSLAGHNSIPKWDATCLLRMGLSYQILSALLGSSQQGQRSVPVGGRADAILCLRDFAALFSSHPLKCEKQTWVGDRSSEESVPQVSARMFLPRVKFCWLMFGFFCSQPRSWLHGHANPGLSYWWAADCTYSVCSSPSFICSSQILCMLSQHVNLIFYYYFWFKSAVEHAVLQQNTDFSAQLWLGMAGQKLLQPTVTLASATCARASFVLLHDAYLAFCHGPALTLRSMTTPWTSRYWVGWFSAPCGG